MRQIPDPEQPSIGLGKPIREEQAEAKDEWEQFKGQHGTNMRRNKRTGAIETDQIPSGPQYPPPAPDLGFIFTSDAWDAVIKGMQQPLKPAELAAWLRAYAMWRSVE